jgi:E3 ubiquitin-protein ligase RNF14
MYIANEKKAIKVKNLTPIILEFKFPVDYPSKNPPEFTISCRWLSIEQVMNILKINLINMPQK